jgi:hypothetical protein
MKQKDFRELQRRLDDNGVITAIIRSGKLKGRRYEVIANGELLKKYRHRVSAKKRIIKLFNQTIN